MLKRLSLKIKLSMLLLVVSVVPLGLFSGLVIEEYDQQVKDTVKHQQTTITVSAAKHLNEWLGMKITAIQQVTRQYESVFLSGDMKRIMPLLEMLHYADSQNISYSYVDINGMSYASDGVIADLSSTRLPAEMDKRVVVSDVIEDPAKGRKMVIISVPILDREGEYRGTVASIMDVKGLEKDITLMSSEQAGTTYLVSSKGMVLVHPDEEIIGAKIFGIEIETEENFSLWLKRTMTQSSGTIDYEDKDQVKWTASYAEVELTGWRVIVAAKTKEIYASSRVIERTAFFILIGLTLVAVALSMLFLRIIHRPMMRVSTLMKKVTAGDLSERLSVDSQDELGTLNQNINTMLDSFTEMLGNLEKTMKSEQELLVRNILMDKQSKMDALTGLYNHKSYHEYMDKLIEQTQHLDFNLQLIILDIDNFKKVNDTYGHAVGDIALTVVAERIMEHMDSNDFAARYGGEEFVILLTSKNDELNSQILENIRASIENTPIAEMGGVNVTASMGAYTVKRGDTKEKVFDEADQALYRAKRTGKNKVVIADENAGSKEDM